MKYADQRAHDVTWMTAEERNEYDRVISAVAERLAAMSLNLEEK